MSEAEAPHPETPQGFHDEVAAAIEAVIPGARARVAGGGGHFSIEVVSDAFAGKRLVQRQRLVYGAITRFMSGDSAPLHAVDRLVCRTPDE